MAMSEVLQKLESQRGRIQGLREELVRGEERVRGLDAQIAQAEKQLTELGVTSVAQVQQMDQEAERLAAEIEQGLADLDGRLERLNGTSTTRDQL
jgi:SMC interacting uncharacterized protein involved in chromosome segregation